MIVLFNQSRVSENAEEQEQTSWSALDHGRFKWICSEV